MRILFMPECYFDTVLVKKLVKNNDLVWHQKGCNKVVNKCITLKNTFNVGIIDKDKKDIRELRSYKTYSLKGLNIYFKEGSNSIIIQINPPLEKWIIDICEEEKIDLSKFSLPQNPRELRYITKSQIVEETKGLQELCDQLIKSENEIIARLKSWIEYIMNNFDKVIDYNIFQNG